MSDDDIVAGLWPRLERYRIVLDYLITSWGRLKLLTRWVLAGFISEAVTGVSFMLHN